GHSVRDHRDHDAADHGVEDPALATEEAGTADDGGADGQQQRVAGAFGRRHRTGLGGQPDTGQRRHERADHEHRDADPVDRDTGPARGFGVAADRVDVPAVAGAPEHDRPHDDQRDHQRYGPRHAFERLVVGHDELAVDDLDRVAALLEAAVPVQRV